MMRVAYWLATLSKANPIDTTRCQDILGPTLYQIHMYSEIIP